MAPNGRTCVANANVFTLIRLRGRIKFNYVSAKGRLQLSTIEHIASTSHKDHIFSWFRGKNGERTMSPK